MGSQLVFYYYYYLFIYLFIDTGQGPLPSLFIISTHNKVVEGI